MRKTLIFIIAIVVLAFGAFAAAVPKDLAATPKASVKASVPKANNPAPIVTAQKAAAAIVSPSEIVQREYALKTPSNAAGKPAARRNQVSLSVIYSEPIQNIPIYEPANQSNAFKGFSANNGARAKI